LRGLAASPKKSWKTVGKKPVSGDIHYDGERSSTNKRRSAMKTLNLVLLAVMVAVTGYAQETKVEKPKALVKAQEAYEKEAARVLEPVNMAYLRTLESIKKDLGVRGDTAGMVAVQAAIDEVKEYLKSGTMTEGEAEKMVVGKWIIGRGNYKDSITLRSDGTCIDGGTGQGTWKIKNDALVLVFKVSDTRRDTWTAKFPLKPKMTILWSYDRKTWTFERDN
jgi:hypothetical protein